IRHFTTGRWDLPDVVELRQALIPLLCLLIVGTAVIAFQRRRTTAPFAKRYAQIALIHSCFALVGTALLLAPARTWWLESIDAERYGFAVLAPVCALVGAVAAWRYTRPLAVVGLVVLALWPASRLVRATFRPGPDGGVSNTAGGGFRGWRTASNGVGSAELVWREVELLRREGPVTVVVTDYFGLGAVQFPVLRNGGEMFHDTAEGTRRWYFPEANAKAPDRAPVRLLQRGMPWDMALKGGTIVVPVFAEEVVAGSGSEGFRHIARAQFLGRFRTHARDSKIYYQRDGTPFLELLIADVPEE
ncbi:MAG: hypothetical protein AAGF12_10300, partial [Myxococcota bacterium]